jgi:heme exporter protein D
MGPETAPQSGLFNPAERKRMISLSVVAVAVLGMVIYGWYDRADKVEKFAATAQADAVEQLTADVVVITPEVDVAAIEALVANKTPEDQLVIAGPALEAIFEPARLLSDAHFDPMGGVLLDEERMDAIDATLTCGQLVRARGFIEEIDTFDSSGSTAHYRGRLRLEGERHHVWFAVVALPEAYGEVGDFVRMDGLFLKTYRGAAANGEWLTAPLIVGPRAVQSFPALEPITELDPNVLRFVEDDGVDGISPTPFYEYWRLLSFAQNVAPDSVDWSDAPKLDGELIREIAKDGDAWRGKPVRFPPAQLLDIWDQAQGENPARIAKLAEAWAGNEYWARTTTGVIRIVAPFERGDLRRSDFFTGRGFFFRNFAYERADGNLAIAPFFVMHSIDEFVPIEDDTFATIFTAIALGLVVILLLAFVGVMRDRKKTEELQAELRRRRRARRAAPQPTT